ncbi:hypothetical protein EJB05_01141, partial [Eragrostis curvula]
MVIRRKKRMMSYSQSLSQLFSWLYKKRNCQRQTGQPTLAGEPAPGSERCREFPVVGVNPWVGSPLLPKEALQGAGVRLRSAASGDPVVLTIGERNGRRLWSAAQGMVELIEVPSRHARPGRRGADDSRRRLVEVTFRRGGGMRSRRRDGKRRGGRPGGLDSDRARRVWVGEGRGRGREKAVGPTCWRRIFTGRGRARTADGRLTPGVKKE